MDDLGAALEKLLNDPAALSQAMALAGTLGLDTSETPPEQRDPTVPAKRLPGGNAAALLEALAPLLGEGKQEKLRRAKRALQLSRGARAALEGMRQL